MCPAQITYEKIALLGIGIPGRLDAISDQISDAIYVFRYCNDIVSEINFKQ